MRWAYIKNGDAAEQLQRIGTRPEQVPDGGPDAFIGDFLTWLGDSPLLVLSCSNEAATVHDGHATARTFSMRPGALGKPGKVLRLLHAGLGGFWMLLKFRPDRLICGRLGVLLQVSFIVARLLGVPWIHSRHNSIEQPGAGLLYRWRTAIDKALIRRADGVICHGPFLVQEAKDFGVAAGRVFEFDVGYTDYLAQAQAAQLPDTLAGHAGKRWIVFVGRVETGKGVFDLLQAASPLLAADDEVRLVIVGDGPDLARLSRQVADDGLQDKVLVTGRVSHQHTAAIVGASTVAVTPTRSEFPEGRCMSAMEALVLGKPLIAPDLGPFPYLVNDGDNGLLYTPDSAAELGDCLTRVLTDNALMTRLSDGARASGQQLLVPEHTFSQAVRKAFVEF